MKALSPTEIFAYDIIFLLLEIPQYFLLLQKIINHFFSGENSPKFYLCWSYIVELSKILLRNL